MRTDALGCMAGLLVLSAVNPAHALGICGFDKQALTFQGSPAVQAQCLLRPVKQYGHLGEPLEALPSNLNAVLSKSLDDGMRLKDGLRKRLLELKLTEADIGGSLDRPISRARNNDPKAPMAKYFVIHDTSSPYYGNQAFPADVDNDKKINNVAAYQSENAAAHLFISRLGFAKPKSVYVGHDFEVPWRATKFELKEPGGIGPAAKGLFIHIESVQPRRRDPNGGPKNDAVAPKPGFSAEQYDALALVYVAASLRANKWLIPAYHAVLDHGFKDAHDDPQNFELDQFDASLGRLLQVLAPMS